MHGGAHGGELEEDKQTGREEDRPGDDQMKGEKRQKGGGSEKTQA